MVASIEDGTFFKIYISRNSAFDYTINGTTINGKKTTYESDFCVKEVGSIYGNGTFIAGMAMSAMDTRAGRLLVMGGSYVFRSSTRLGQLSLGREAVIAGDFMKASGKALGYAGLVLTGADMLVNGVNTSNSLDMAMGIISFVPGWGWIAGGLYFIGNATLEATTGKNLGQHIDDYINSHDPSMYQCPITDPMN